MKGGKIIYGHVLFILVVLSVLFSFLNTNLTKIIEKTLSL